MADTHAHAPAVARIGGGVVLTACGCLTLAFGGRDSKTYGWASAFLALAALSFVGGLRGLRPHRPAPGSP